MVKFVARRTLVVLVVLALLLLAWHPQPSSASPCTLPYVVGFASGLIWTFLGPESPCLYDAMGVGDVVIDPWGNPVSGIFDLAFVLFYNGVAVVSPFEDDGYQALDGSYVFDTVGPPNESYPGIQINWQHMFFNSRPYVRVIYTFENNNMIPVVFNAEIQTNLGSNAQTVVHSTSSKDTLFTTEDRWIITHDSDCNSTTSFFFFANDSYVTPSLASLQTTFVCHGTEGIRVSFPLRLESGQIVSLAVWGGVFQGCPPSNNAFTDANSYFDNLETLMLADFLDEAELYVLANWPSPHTPSPSFTTSVTPTNSVVKPSTSPSISPSLSTLVSAPTHRRTSTPTPTHHNDHSYIVPKHHYQFYSNAVLLESTTRVTESDHEDGFSVLILFKHKQRLYLYGVVTFPPKLIPVGWVVRITAVEQDDLEKPKPGKNKSCGENDDDHTGQLVSIAFDLVIRDDKGHERTLQELLKHTNEKGISIELVYALTEDQQDCFDRKKKELRFIYLEDGDDSWSFVDDGDSIERNTFGNISTTVNHLTSFAVLLAGTEGVSGPSDVLWIISVCLLGGACILSVLIVKSFYHFEPLRRLLFGYDRNAKSIDQLEQHLKVQMNNAESRKILPIKRIDE
eukprot:TRINITY_DN3595_c0_g2_i1.p1 TRINITY_DN3595_c0_g2~~TRINITY_DN3595_c0_g2_i1.p1  ORF type:complete len:623 (-),score=111.54 TRINITY_DN3595_c0_g2_i1:206-2074(-)